MKEKQLLVSELYTLEAVAQPSENGRARIRVDLKCFRRAEVEPLLDNMTKAGNNLGVGSRKIFIDTSKQSTLM